MAAAPPTVELLHDQAACGLLLTANDGTILQANTTFCRWVGLTADVLVQRRRLQDLLTVGARIFHQTHWAPLLQLQGSVSEVKVDFRHADGRKIPCVMNARGLDWHGEVLHQVSVFVAEDRHQYEMELVRARKRSDELLVESQAKTAALVATEAVLNDAMAQLRTRTEDAQSRAQFAEQMMGIVSHDLRNPLSVLRLIAQVLASTTALDQSRLRKLTERMLRAVSTGDRLIADMLDFTAAKIGKGLGIQARSIDLHAVVAEALADLSTAYPAHTLAHVSQGTGTCCADPGRMVQALGNLVTNAVKYGAPDRPVQVTSSVTPESAFIEVQNEGQPIAAELLPFIFEPMTQGDRVGDSSSRSVGLGLYIVSEIARAHGGRVDVSSNEEGTHFTIALPQRAEGER